MHDWPTIDATAALPDDDTRQEGRVGAWQNELQRFRSQELDRSRTVDHDGSGRSRDSPVIAL